LTKTDGENSTNDSLIVSAKVTKRQPLASTLSLRSLQKILTFSILTLASLAVLYSIYYAAGILMPITLSILLTLILQPTVRFLSSFKIPSILSAALIVGSIVGLVGFGFYRLAVPAAQWVERAPELLGVAEAKFQPLREPLIKFQEVKDQVGELSITENDNADEKEKEKEDTGYVQAGLDLPSTLQASSSLFIKGVFIVMLVFLMLASEGNYSRKIVSIMPTFKDKRRAVELISAIQSCISKYLATITIINLGVGVVTSILMWTLAMPNPLLWGVLATTLNFVPYIGPLITWLIIALVSFFSLDSFHQILLPPFAFMVVTGIEGQLVTPLYTGRQLKVSPVANFVFLAFMGWLWGVVGMLIAIPLLASIKILCTQITLLNPIAILLGSND
jgi:predicted PurR-regulated permease PerM